MKKHRLLWVIRIVFFLSLLLLVFSVIQVVSEDTKVEQSLEQWEEKKTPSVNESPVTVVNLDKQDSEELSSLKTTVNETQPENSPPPLYQTYPKKGEVFGKLIIPKIEKEFPIVHGTEKDELAKGVGHYLGSVLPGESDNTVLAGHRDTVFRELGDVKTGDTIIIETSAGKFIYEIYEQRIVDKNDRTVIVPYDNPVLTLVTCYPFDYIGPAPKRFILTGKLAEHQVDP